MSSSRTQAKSPEPASSSSKASAQPPAGPRLVSDRTTETGIAVPRSSPRTAGSLALSTTMTEPGRTVWAAMAVEAPGQGRRCVVRQDERHDTGARAPPASGCLVVR